MRAIANGLKLLMATALACAMAGLPSCASMGGGGGGMRYAVPEPVLSADSVVSM